METRTTGSASGLGKRTGNDPDTAPRPTQRFFGRKRLGKRLGDEGALGAVAEFAWREVVSSGEAAGEVGLACEAAA